LEHFLDPEILKTNLIQASLYIVAFEILKDSVIEQIQNFYTALPAEYKEEVLSRNKSKVYASLQWLEKSETITNKDIERFNKIKKCRNSLAHEIHEMLIEGFPPDFMENFVDMVALLDKIEKWWIVNVDIPSNSDFDDKIVNESEIVPGPVSTLQMMLDIALGSNGTANFYINEFKKYK